MLLFLQELANAVLTEHFSRVVHASIDCVLLHGDFQQLCHAASKTCAISTTNNQIDHVIELQLLEEAKIVTHRTADGMDVSLDADMYGGNNTLIQNLPMNFSRW